MTTPYVTGTITLTSGSAVVTGTGTAWQAALISGGIIHAEAAGGNAMPILTVDGNTQVTAATKWKGATGSYPYALVVDTTYDRQVLANATALAQVLQSLKTPAVAAMSALTPAADRLAYFTGSNMAALATLTAFARTLLDDADAGTALSTLGVSAFARTLLDDADASAALSTLGVSAFMKTLLDDANAGAVLSTLGISAFIRTLLDDADAGTAISTLGAQAALGFTPVQQGGGGGQAAGKVRIGGNGSGALLAQVDTTDLGRLWADGIAPSSLGSRGYQKLPSGLILQWGYEASTTPDLAITFPIAFPANLCCVAATMIAGANQGVLYGVVTAAPSLAGTSFRKRYAGSGTVGQASEPFYWLAIGY